MSDMDAVWQAALADTLAFGSEVAPRGQPTKELIHRTIKVDMARPVVTVPQRKLNYRFAAAEALWILMGENELAPLVKFNAKMAEFSDDGVTLAGAYGPKIISQMPYILDKLQEDRDTRQATLTIWERNPGPSKDIPCTVAMSFMIRNNRLLQSVYMRSSDVWLGLPYDVFSFSMLGLAIVGELNRRGCPPLSPGSLSLTAASSHLYLRNKEDAITCLGPGAYTIQPLVPNSLWRSEPQKLIDRLQAIRDGDKVHRWWTPDGFAKDLAEGGNQ